MLASVRRIFADPTGFGFESSHPVTIRSFTLKEPDRLVVDLKGARLEPSARVELASPARASQYQADTVRIVLETSWRVRGGLPESSSGGAWLLEDPDSPAAEPPTPEVPAEPQPERPQIGPIVAVRSGPREAAFELPIPPNLTNQARLEREAPERIAIRLPLAEWVPPAKPLPGVRLLESESTPAATIVRLHLERPMVLRSVLEGNVLRFTLVRPEASDGKLAGKTVVVDAGHGGQDSGARAPGGGALEKDLNLAMALELAAQLSRNGADVILTRSSDTFLPLRERSEIANRAKASFFISVHVNSNQVANSRSGTMVFHHKTDPVGQLLADCIQREIGKVSGLPNLGTWSDGRIYASGFAVLRYATMPAVLLELGFINHGSDLRRIRTDDFRKKVASAVVKGLKVFVGDGQSEER
jgi:N-acetylmuramoyl-L-alanine amidase